MKVKTPTLKEISKIQEMLKPFVEEGVILYRDDDEIATNIRSYKVVLKDDKIVGLGALHIHSKFLGEIRSLAVSREFQGRKVGSLIVKELLKDAKELGIKEILVLTYKKEFFEKMGFNEIDKTLIPDKKIWADCVKCKFFPNCNETALIQYL